MEMEIGESAQSVEQEEAMERYENRGGQFLPLFANRAKRSTTHPVKQVAMAPDGES